MFGNLSKVPQEAISAAATFRPSRQLLAEPLWFALMCREIYGANAAKDIQFVLDKSERTCRAWASGESVPPSTVLWALIDSDRGDEILKWLMRNSARPWWAAIQRARKIVAQVDQLDLD